MNAGSLTDGSKHIPFIMHLSTEESIGERTIHQHRQTENLILTDYSFDGESIHIHEFKLVLRSRHSKWIDFDFDESSKKVSSLREDDDSFQFVLKRKNFIKEKDSIDECDPLGFLCARDKDMHLNAKRKLHQSFLLENRMKEYNTTECIGSICSSGVSDALVTQSNESNILNQLDPMVNVNEWVSQEVVTDCPAFQNKSRYTIPMFKVNTSTNTPLKDIQSLKSHQSLTEPIIFSQFKNQFQLHHASESDSDDHSFVSQEVFKYSESDPLIIHNAEYDEPSIMNSLTNLHSQDDHRINVLEHFLNETHHKRQNHNESQFGEANFIKGNLESPERSFTHSQSQSQIVSPVFASPTSSPINLYSTLSDIDAKSKKNYSAMVSQKEILNLSGMYETNEKTKLSNQHHETNQNTKLSNHCLVSSSIDERIHDDFVDESQLPSQFVDSFKKHISTPKTALKNPFILESPLEGEFVVLDDCGDSDGSVLIRKSSDIQSSDLCNLNTESQEMSIDLNENIADESFLFQQNDINLDGKSYNRSFTHRELANCMEDYVSQNISIDGTNDLRIIHKDNTYLDNHTINFNCQVKSITNDRLVGLTLTDLNERINDPDSIDSNDNHISNLNTSVRRAPTFSMKVDLNKWV